MLIFQLSTKRICACISIKLKSLKSVMEDSATWPSVKFSFSLPFGKGGRTE